MAILEDLRRKHEIIRAVSYARFSTDMQREESVEAQMRAIEEFAERNQIVMVGSYVDRGKSGTNTDRVEFQQMLADSSKGIFHLVLVHKLDRFARNRLDSINSRVQLKRNSVTVLSVTQLYDSETPEGLMMESMLEMMAEYYSKNLSREVMKGLKENAYKGLHTGGTPPLGYSLDRNTMKLIVNEDEAVIVRLIFKRFVEGYSYGEIMEECNSKGYKTKRGSDFTKNSLHSILNNEKYIGVYVYNKSVSKDVDGKRNGHKYKDPEEIIRIEDAVPAIIEEADFEVVRKKMQTRQRDKKHSRAIETYLLKTKMICGICGGSYVGARRLRGAKGSYWVAYGCNIRHRNRKGSGCTNKEISKPFIEGVVLKKLSEYVFHDKYIPRITKEYNQFLKSKNSEYQSEYKGYQSQLKDLSRKIDSLVDMLMKTQSEILLDKLKTMEAEKVQLEAKLQTIEQNGSTTQLAENDVCQAFGKIRELMKTGDLRNIKQVIDTYISKIIVYPKNVEIHFNFFPSITLEIEGGGDEGSRKDCPHRQSFLSSHQNIADGDDLSDHFRYGQILCFNLFCLI